LSLQIISEMRQLVSFQLPVVTIRARRKDSKINISLHIRSRDLAPAKHHISGFPRAVMNDSQPRSSSSTTLPSVRRDSPRDHHELPTSSEISELDAQPPRPAIPHRSVSEQTTSDSAERLSTYRRTRPRSIDTVTSHQARRRQPTVEVQQNTLEALVCLKHPHSIDRRAILTV